MLGERGMWFKKHFFDHAARVPLIIHAPWRFGAARRRENVLLVDLLPTLCELAQVDLAGRAPRPPDGESLVPLCGDPAALRETPVFAEITSEGVPAPMFMVRHGPFKLMTGGGTPDVLFDVRTDPDERTDLAADPGSANVLAALHRLAERTWDSAALAQEIGTSQRERRLVQESHYRGPARYGTHLSPTPYGRRACVLPMATTTGHGVVSNHCFHNGTCVRSGAQPQRRRRGGPKHHRGPRRPFGTTLPLGLGQAFPTTGGRSPQCR